MHLLAFQSRMSDDALKKPDPPHPYRVTGHVGYSFNKGETIFGFGPHLPEGMTPLEAIDSLRKKTVYPGKITDDTAVFRDVADTPFHRDAVEEQVVVILRVPMSKEAYKEAKAWHKNYGLNRPLNISYGFPNGKSDFENCATFPRKLGIPIPEETGNLWFYLEEMQKNGTRWKLE